MAAGFIRLLVGHSLTVVEAGLMRHSRVAEVLFVYSLGIR